MGHECGHDEGDAAGDQGNADDVSETLAGADLLDGHDDAERRHPDHVHHADREHHQHHRPAAAEAVQPLLDAEPEHAARRGRPIGKEERERALALLEAGVFERRELVDAGADEDRARKQSARRSHPGIEQRGAREAVLRHGRCGRKAEPHQRVAGGQHEGRDDALALARGGVGDLGVSEDHRRRARQHHGERHRAPHETDDGKAARTPCRAIWYERPAHRFERTGTGVHEAKRQPAKYRQRDHANDGQRLRPREHKAESARGGR